MDEPAQHTGAWAGTNALRLMRQDTPQEATLRAVVTRAAKGALTAIAYTWAHPDAGEQDGLLVATAPAATGAGRSSWT